jgi:hypothetical protein
MGKHSEYEGRHRKPAGEKFVEITKEQIERAHKLNPEDNHGKEGRHSRVQDGR